VTLAYRKRALNEAYPLSRRLDFVPQTRVTLFWDGEVPSYADLRRESRLLLEDAQLNSMFVNALRLRPRVVDIVREGYSRDSFSGDEGEWTKDSQIEATIGYFWRLDRLCVPQNSELRVRLMFERHDNSSASLIGVASTLVRELDRFWWKRIRQDVKDVCERCVVCRQAEIQLQMAATLYPLSIPL
jgi:hypothetical protein